VEPQKVENVEVKEEAPKKQPVLEDDEDDLKGWTN
jgi:hypothetical protein